MYLCLKSYFSLSIISEDIPTNSMYLRNLVGILFSKHKLSLTVLTLTQCIVIQSVTLAKKYL